MAVADRTFNALAVQKAFAECLSGSDDILMDKYILGYKEICSFFDVLGTVFGFVSSDVHSKIEILEALRSGPNADHFATVKTMMNYETENNLIKQSGYVSGSRTLLRLHRGLDFIRQFLQRMSQLEPTAKAAPCCQEVYSETLAQYHPWLIRKGANVAMYALPTKDVLLQKMCGSEEDVKNAIKLLPDMLDVTAQVYNGTEKLYDDFRLKELP